MTIKKQLLFLCFIFSSIALQAQNGNLIVTITSNTAGYKPITITVKKPLFRFDDTHGYWGINPHNGSRHFTLEPPPGYGNADAAFIDITDAENDFDIYTGTSNDSDNFSFSNTIYSITAPAWNVQDKEGNKPLHFHFSSFTNAEVSFTVSGTVRIITRNGSNETMGTISGSGHFYREPKFAQTDILPGCNCDATIYPKVYDQENNIRTASQCEVALKNKVFLAMQKTFAPVFANVGSSTTGKRAPGDIVVTILPGHTDINVPTADPDFCNTKGQQRITGFNAQKSYYNNEDGYGVRLIKLSTDEQLGVGSSNDANTSAMKNYMDKMKEVDSLSKLFQAKKITMEEYMKKGKVISDNANAALSKNSNNKNDAFEIAKVETDLSIQVFLNPDNAEMMLMKVSDKNKTVIEHTIKGTAFEIFSPMIKDSDGSYLLNKKFLYFGKFTAPVNGKSGGGFDAKVTKAIYPINGNKLSVYNIIIRMEGSKDMIDKSCENIDFAALEQLISKQ